MPNRPLSQSINLAGASLSWRATGDPSLSPVLLLHGFPLTGQMWAQQEAVLRENYRVITPDLRGYGESTLGDWPDESPTLARYADDVGFTLEMAGIKQALPVVGFSMGGYIALELLRRHPQLVSALALIDSRVVADDDAGRAGRLKMADKAAEWGSARIAGMMRPKLLASDAPEAAVKATLTQIEYADPAAIAASQRAMAARPDSTGLIRALSVPLLAVAGEHDEISTPAEMRGFAELAPRGEFHQIDGAGHMAPVEAPGAVNAVLTDWLARVAEPTPT